MAMLTFRLSRWHQDVKPSNVLVFSNRAEGEYWWTFKLADLGISHFHAIAYAGDTGEATDQQGTSTYGRSPRPGQL